MVESKIKCDHCGKVIDETRDYDGCEIDLPVGWWQNVELCKECAGLLCQTVGEFLHKKF